MTRRRRTYETFGAVLLRTPLFPICDYLDWSTDLTAPVVLERGDGHGLEAAVADDRRRLRERLRSFFARPAADEALLLASPGFRRGVRELDVEGETKANRDLGITGVRYLTRLSTRSTPFGTAAGTSFGHIGSRTRLQLAEPEHYERVARLDGAYVYGLARALEKQPACQPHVRYRPNDTLYGHGRSLRYYETVASGGDPGMPAYHLVDLERTEPLACILEWAAQGETIELLARAIERGCDVDASEAEGFVHELIERNVLVGDVTPPPVGEEPLAALRRRLQTIPTARSVARVLEGLQCDLDGLSKRPPGTAVADYERLSTVAARLHPRGGRSWLHVDMYKPAQIAIHPRVIDDVLDAVDLLAKLGAVDDPLADFRARFLVRYADQERPLCEVLDEESGVGFRPPDPRGSPLLEGLGLGRSPRAAADTISQWMVAWLQEVWACGQQECEIGAELAAALTDGKHSEPPSQLCALLRLAARDEAAVDEGDYEVLLNGVSCAPASKLIGRFAHGNHDALRLAEESVAVENEHNNPCLTAEIVHLSSPEAANVTCRPGLRSTQIPILSATEASADRIPLSDLAVRVVGDEVVLRSVSRDCRVIPAMASAVDPRRSPVSAYAFLDAVGRSAYQRRAPNWAWPAALRQTRFLPRIRIGRVVVARAQWRIAASDMASEVSAAAHDQLRRIHALRARFGIPRHVVVREGDRELLLDLHNSLCVDVVVKTLRTRREIHFIEAFGLEHNPVHDGRARYAHDLIVPLRATRSRHQPVPRRHTPSVRKAGVRRVFPPGSEWAYVRLFTSPRGVDRLIVDLVPKLMARCRQDVGVDRWFFLRYAKGGSHLRLRIHAQHVEKARELVACVLGELGPTTEGDEVWRVELGTYERECERYGGPEAIAIAEDMFTADSECVVQTLGGLSPHGRSGDARWLAAAVGVDRLLADFQIPLAGREALVSAQARTLSQRWALAQSRQRRIDARYRGLRERLDDALSGKDPDVAPSIALLGRRSDLLVGPVARLLELDSENRLAAPLLRIVGSFVHMHINRMMFGSPVAHELVICDFLAKHYRSRIARGGDCLLQRGVGRV